MTTNSSVSTETTQRLLELAARHHGVVTTAWAAELGVHPNALLKRAGAGVLERVDQGVFVVRGSVDTFHQRATLACCLAGHDAVLSHRAAALHWDLDGVDRAPMEVTVPRWRRRRDRPNQIVHESSLWLPGDRQVRHGVPATSPARTLIDLAAVVHPYRLEQAVEDAARRGLCGYEQLADRFVGLALPGRRGTKAMAALLQERVGEEVPTKAMSERRAVQLIRSCHLPEPVRQHPVDLGDTVVYLDLAWPDLLLAVECDGLFHHATNVALPWDDDRQNQLVLLGWLVLRFTWRQLTREGDRCRHQLRVAHAERTRRSVPHHPHR